ncbi:MAG: diacylglycerol/lipid kinase family protein, partial [Gemmatimonadales bacterium]
DLGVVDRADGPHYFAVAAGTGFDARLMSDTGLVAKRRWKLGAYVARALLTLHDVRSAGHRVTVDGVAHEVRAAMVLVLNCGRLPPGFFQLRPGLTPDDGWLDVLALRADGAWQGVAAVVELLAGAWRNGGRGPSPRVWWGRGRDVRVDVVDGDPRPVQLDGEVAGVTPFQARLLPGALRVLAPGDRGAV